MSSFDDPGDSSSFDGNDTTNHKPWPHVLPSQQAQVEKKFFEDGATIHFDRLPQMQSWASLLGVGSPFQTISILRDVMSHATGTHRRLTAVEVQALSEHTAKRVRQFAWTQPVSIAGAIAATVITRKTFKFPFYQPKMTRFDPYMFPTKYMPFLKGARAAAVWHIVRFVTFQPLVWIPTALFFTSTSSSSFKAHVMRDPRLSTMVNDISKNHPDPREVARQQERRRLGIPDPARRNTPPQAEGDATQFPSAEQASQPQNSFPQEYGSETISEASTPSVDTYTPPRQSSWVRSAPPQAPFSKPQRNNFPDASSQNAADDLDLFDADDASPVSASSRKADTSQAQSSSGGSAWDRVRQQSRPEVRKWQQGDSSGQEKGWAQLRQDKTPNTRDATPKTESFAYTKEEVERETRDYEKEQAQKEFDAMLEAERSGQPGGAGSASGWRRSK
ncbi:Uu.00g121790.m01.CDS01 [Anthostomella pinea]|uniref:Uu.00g121790.m01.CDS01 n=1 Tax=Anthostomella pinea TaxID=933095 RepID=A0AAI8YH91_9PEZI|nr:Uu.00g121790.m01.CDS01 [Anthostomella pinea]